MVAYNQSILGIFLLSVILGRAKLSGGSFDNLNCPGLNQNRNNIHLQCFNRSQNVTTDCSLSMPPGSTANYTCPKYFKPANPKLNFGGTIFCRQGEWKFYSEFTRFACVPVCGQWMPVKDSAVKLRPPWHVEIYNGRTSSRGLMGRCQGTLIPSPVGNASSVITSRSCISKLGGMNKIKNELTAIVGQSTIKYQIAHIFFPASEREDLVILRLSQPTTLSDGVLPICILSPVNHSLPNSTNGFIFGIEPSSNADIWVNLTRLSPEGCRILGFSPARDEFCALKSNSDGSMCSDIFQSFLVHQKEEGEDLYYLYGVPKGQLQVNSCPTQGVVYTLLSAHANWIQATLKTHH